MIGVIVIITALSGVVATAIFTLLEFIEQKITRREEDYSFGIVYYRALKKDLYLLDEPKKKLINRTVKFIYGIFWSWIIPVLFIIIQPKSLTGLDWLIITYFIIFSAQETLIFYVLKVSTPIWDIWESNKKQALWWLIERVLYSISGVFVFVYMAFFYVTRLAH